VVEAERVSLPNVPSHSLARASECGGRVSALSVAVVELMKESGRCS